MKARALYATAVVLLLGTLFAAGCRDTGQSQIPQQEAPKLELGAPQAPAATTAVKRGGTLRSYEVVPRTEGNLDNIRSTAGAAPGRMGGEGLLRLSAKYDLIPALAEKWTVSNDGLTYTFNLRQGVKFHNKPPANGRELEAKDVVTSYKYLMGWLHPGEPPLNFPRAANAANLKSVEAVDKYTVKMTLSAVNPDFLHGIADGRMVIHPDGLLEAMGGQALRKMPDAAVFTGPFSLESWDQKTRVVWKKHPTYWDKGADGQPLPYLDEIVWQYVGDHQTGQAAFRTGQLDYVTGMGPKQARELQSTSPPGTQVFGYPGGTRTYFVINWKNGQYSETPNVWKDLRARRAIHLAIDRCEVGELYQPGGWRSQLFIGWWFPESRSQEEIGKLPGFRCDKTADLQEAKRLLTEAGYPKGFKIRLEYVAGIGTGAGSGKAEHGQVVAAQLQRDLQKIGLTEMVIVQKTLEAAEEDRLELEFQYDMLYDGSFMEPTPAFVLYADWHSEGGRNYSGLADPAYDKMWADMASEQDQAKRRQKMRNIEDWLLENLWWIPMNGQTVWYVHHGYVKNVSPSWAQDPASRYYKPDWYVWLDK